MEGEDDVFEIEKILLTVVEQVSMNNTDFFVT